MDRGSHLARNTRNTRRVSKAVRGFSTTEMATVLMVSSLLTTAAAPSLEHYVSLAQQVRALHDARTIAVSLWRMRDDVGGQVRSPKGLATFALLVGDGKHPEISAGGDPRWLLPVTASDVDRLANHLLRNGAAYRRTAPGPGGGWRGPYIESGVAADPWGHRYAVNAEWLERGSAVNVIVLSAGPNGVIETPFESDDIEPGGDDVLALVSSGG